MITLSGWFATGKVLYWTYRVLGNEMKYTRNHLIVKFHYYKLQNSDLIYTEKNFAMACTGKGIYWTYQV